MHMSFTVLSTFGTPTRTPPNPCPPLQTEKIRQQMFEFKSYLAERGAKRVYLQNLIFFSGLRETDLPKRPHNCIGVDASFERLLNRASPDGLARLPTMAARRAYRHECGPESLR